MPIIRRAGRMAGTEEIMTESFAEMFEESFANQKIKPGAILTGTSST